MNRTQQFKIETPIGSIESDSGNHLVDISTVLIVIVFILLLKKVMEKI